MKRAIPAFILALAAFICFILVTVTAPFIKGLYLANISSTNGQLGMNLGVFGVCYPGSTSVLGIKLFDQACTKPTYPYKLDPKFFGYNTTSAANANPLSNDFLQNDAAKLVEGIAKATILNPITAAFALLAFIPSLISICSKGWRFTNVLTWVLLLIATVCAWVSFIINIIFAALTKNRVKKQTNGNFTAKYGNAVWVSLAGAILMTLAMTLALFGAICCIKRNKDVEEDVHHQEAAHDLEAHALRADHSLEETHSGEKVHPDGTPVAAPKKKFALPWGKKADTYEH